MSSLVAINFIGLLNVRTNAMVSLIKEYASPTVKYWEAARNCICMKVNVLRVARKIWKLLIAFVFSPKILTENYQSSITSAKQ